MKATCPKNPKHKRFVTTAHVMQEWVVNELGDFNRVSKGGQCLEVTAEPSSDNIWICDICGAEANVED